MKNAVITGLLWIPAVVQVGACLGLAMFGSKLGFAIQSRQRGPGPAELLIGVVLAAMHAGYVLGPLWWGTGRRWWAVGLMVPVALVVFAALMFVFREALSGEGTGGQRRTAMVALLIAAVVYVAPMVVVGIARR
jgi:hypothetical protein